MKRILVRAPNWIGDQIMAFPFFWELRKKYPHAWIASVCTDWVKDIQFKGLVDDVFVLPKKRGDSYLVSYLKLKKFSKRIKAAGPWDLGISLPNSFGSALLLKWSDAQNRIGYNTDLRSILLTHKIQWEQGQLTHRAQSYLNLLELKIKIENQMKNFDPILHWPDSDTIEVPNVPYFIVAPGATADSRRWSLEEFSKIIEMISHDTGLTAVIVGGVQEKKAAKYFLDLGLSVLDFTAKAWVSAHFKLFQKSKFTICNESGLAHVASFCGSPVLIICGAADPKRTKPLGPAYVQVITNSIDCWPCEKNKCRFVGEFENRCLKGISAESIFKELKRGFIES